ncbi:hypothetical protein [Actinoplanes couchii]|uniref:Uncharacterized protein n=1 Tax=Actinoplanes couchii TaxID=403638 RepID=A0ABQ3XRJ1_9ACTN|nr:hypothetical protein [Actinoplanes couchii]MDR6321455.1 hypothetical protein [Actinoplanes couchii]GID61136.1 hypothetical protein Aco03nite_095400 [Actinoplanes couchii]
MATHTDPHIHVEARLSGSGRTRDMLAATFGLVAELPAAVETGCGTEVPLAMTSHLPERVTCLPCREHASAQHLRFADQVAELGPMPGSPIAESDALRAAAEHRALARRFAGFDSS